MHSLACMHCGHSTVVAYKWEGRYYCRECLEQETSGNAVRILMEVSPRADQAHEAGMSPYQRFCLDRLRRAVWLRDSGIGLDVPSLGVLARHATYSAYQDCVAAGLEERAQRLIGHSVTKTEGA